MAGKKNFTAASLFCGAGGLDMGFDQAGFKTVWANDFEPSACETFKKWNKTAEVVCGDIAKVDYSKIPQTDIMLGGFPCQGFSLSGPRKIDDSRNVLYKHYVKLVKQNQPMAFIGENVKGLLTMGDGEIIKAIIADFGKCGYDVFYKLINAKNYGVPQDRERVIITGFRKDLKVKDFLLPNTNGEKMTLREAIGNLPAAKKMKYVWRLIRLALCLEIERGDGMMFHLRFRRWQSRLPCILVLPIWKNWTRTYGNLEMKRRLVD